jgi:hypothetical protein
LGLKAMGDPINTSLGRMFDYSFVGKQGTDTQQKAENTVENLQEALTDGQLTDTEFSTLLQKYIEKRVAENPGLNPEDLKKEFTGKLNEVIGEKATTALDASAAGAKASSGYAPVAISFRDLNDGTVMVDNNNDITDGALGVVAKNENVSAAEKTARKEKAQKNESRFSGVKQEIGQIVVLARTDQAAAMAKLQSLGLNPVVTTEIAKRIAALNPAKAAPEISPAVPLEKAKETLRNYLTVMCLALMQADPEAQKKMFQEAGEILQEYSKLRNGVDNKAELETFEKQVFNDQDGQVVLGDLKDPARLPELLFANPDDLKLARLTQSRLPKVAELEARIAETQDPAVKEGLELERALLLVQIQINQNVLTGQSTAALEQTRQQLDLNIISNVLEQVSTMLSSGDTAGAETKLAEVTKHLAEPRLKGDENLPGLQFQAAMAGAKVLEQKADKTLAGKTGGGYEDSVAAYSGAISQYQQVYTEFKDKDPALAVKAQLAIASIEKRAGLFDPVNGNPAKQEELIASIKATYEKAINGSSGEQRKQTELESHMVMASFYEKQGKLDQAVTEYRTAVAFTSDPQVQAQIKLMAAGNLIVLEKDDEARAELKGARDLAPDPKSAVYNQSLLMEGAIHAKKGETLDAMAVYQDVINNTYQSDDPALKQLYLNGRLSMAKLNYDGKDLKEGDVSVEQILKKFPGDGPVIAAARFSQGQAYLENGKSVEAFGFFNEVLKNAPQSAEADWIKKNLGDFMVDGQLKFKDGMDNYLAAAQVALRESGGNELYVSVGLAGGGAVIGGAIGFCFAGVGAVPGAMIGAGVGTLADRAIGLYRGSERVSQAYSSGYEDVSALENVLNMAGLALDVIDVVPVGVFLGKGGSFALKAGRKAGLEVAEELGEEGTKALTKKAGTRFTRETLEEAIGYGAREAETMAKSLDKASGLQLAAGIGMITAPGAVEAGAAFSDYASGKISESELKQRLENAGIDTAKNFTSMVGVMVLMSGTSRFVGALDAAKLRGDIPVIRTGGPEIGNLPPLVSREPAVTARSSPPDYKPEKPYSEEKNVGLEAGNKWQNPTDPGIPTPLQLEQMKGSYIIQGSSGFKPPVSFSDGPGIEEIVGRVPKEAKLRELEPEPGKVEQGFEYSWTDESGEAWKVRIHGPTAGAPPGSTAYEGWHFRVEKMEFGNDPAKPVCHEYMDAEGNFHTSRELLDEKRESEALLRRANPQKAEMDKAQAAFDDVTARLKGDGTNPGAEAKYSGLQADYQRAREAYEAIPDTKTAEKASAKAGMEAAFKKQRNFGDKYDKVKADYEAKEQSLSEKQAAYQQALQPFYEYNKTHTLNEDTHIPVKGNPVLGPEIPGIKIY